MSPDGTKMYGVNSNTQVVYEFDLSPAWTGTPTYNSISKDLSAYLGQSYGMGVSPDGQYMLIVDNTGDAIRQFKFGTINDVSTLTYDVSLQVGSEDTLPYGVFYSLGGTAINVIGYNNDNVYQYDLNNSQFTDLYPTGNAASAGAGEANSVANWTLSNGTRGSLSSSSVDKYEGTYSIYHKNILTGSGNINILSDAITVENGATYRVTYRYKTNWDVVDSDQYVDEWLGVVTSPSEPLTATEWTTKSHDVVTNSTSLQLRFHGARFNALLDGELYVDKITIRKIS
jgi:hypothetical protein